MGQRFVSVLYSAAYHTRRKLIQAWRAVELWAVTTIGPTVLRWWGNPLFHSARLEKPLAWRALGKVTFAAAAVLTAVDIAAWLIAERTVGAAMLALPLGIVLVTLMLAPLLGVASAASQFQTTRDNPRQMSTADPLELVWGMALVAQWRLRWLIAACIVVTPPLMVSILRVDAAAFANFRDAVLSLGSAAPPDQVRLLGPGGTIPYFRLVIRAVSVGLFPFLMIPLLATLGVTTTLALRDRTFSQIVSLIGAVVVLLALGGFVELITTTYLMGGWLELARLLLTMATFAGISFLSVWLNRVNTDLLVNIPSDEGII